MKAFTSFFLLLGEVAVWPTEERRQPVALAVFRQTCATIAAVACLGVILDVAAMRTITDFVAVVVIVFVVVARLTTVFANSLASHDADYSRNVSQSQSSF